MRPTPRLRRSAALLLLALLLAGCPGPSASPEVSIPPAVTTATTVPPTSTSAAPSGSSASTSTTATPDPCADLIPLRTEAAVRRVVESGRSVGLVVGIVSPCGREVFAFGEAEAPGGGPLDEDTVFEIGSTGKAFTGLLLAAMAQEGEVALSDPIERYLPPGAAAPNYRGRSITLLDLATHTSGLPSLPPNFAPADESRPYADYTVEQMYEALAVIELSREPGSVYEYSNFGMGLLGHLLELQSGATYEELVIEWITGELAMPDTRVTLTPEMASRLATGHRDGKPFPLWDIPALAGAGALRSTVRDMLTFLAANLGLQESRLEGAMRLARQRFHPVDATMSIGLGWHLRSLGGDTIIEHHGATGGYWCFAGLIEDARVGVVILSNTFYDIDQIGLDLLTGLPG